MLGLEQSWIERTFLFDGLCWYIWFQLVFVVHACLLTMRWFVHASLAIPQNNCTQCLRLLRLSVACDVMNFTISWVLILAVFGDFKFNCEKSHHELHYLLCERDPDRSVVERVNDVDSAATQQASHPLSLHMIIFNWLKFHHILCNDRMLRVWWICSLRLRSPYGAENLFRLCFLKPYLVWFHILFFAWIEARVSILCTSKGWG